MWHTGCFSTNSLVSMKKNLTKTGWHPKPCGPRESSSSRAHAKAERPQDLPQKIKTFEHVYQSKKRGIRKKPVPGTKGKKAKETHWPYDGDGLHGPGSGLQGGPRATSWPNFLIPHGCSVSTWRADIPCPSAVCVAASTCRTGWRSARSTTQWTAKSSPF